MMKKTNLRKTKAPEMKIFKDSKGIHRGQTTRYVREESNMSINEKIMFYTNE